MTSTLAKQGRRITHIVFIALLLDILSFTIILPLLPRSLEAYKARETHDLTLLSSLLARISSLREYIQAHSASSRFLQQGARADLVLLGGLLGSLYSLLQFIVAPWIGRAADRFGRRPVLLLCMLGNILWTLIWLYARSFELFLGARIIAGLSEGNVQLSNTIIADVTDPATRSRGMALVGIAFAVGFTVGPSIGAYFSQLPLEPSQPRSIFTYAPFAAAALFSLVLLLAETLFLYVRLPETLDFKRHSSEPSPAGDSGTEDAATDSLASAQPSAQNNCKQQRQLLQRLNLLHFTYLFFFSGMEYTLTFLTHDQFSFSNGQQGRLLGFIGILSTLLQGMWVRRRRGKSAHTDKDMVVKGMLACSAGLLCIAYCTAMSPGSTLLLWMGAVGFAVASATVVNCLNSMVSLINDVETGKRLGDFRSAGQIGRSMGPLFACSVYWLLGSRTCYFVGSVAVFVISLLFIAFVPASTATISRIPTKKSQ
ncbi:hypothetical protein IWW36_001746 [Coemansia brasiliensis]|uniref:Major facilitator superfamily (MFS) profile domain-containing protein n=1 Tax=Coemansia brasiliensis TaxID=2650707 RepID=A0A9W8M198_9FUNG|nr:hypothetical protein IWW36_001746 [Coemansia brasiliensis]